MNLLKVGAGVAPVNFPAEMFPVEGFSGVHDQPHVRILCLDCAQRAVIASIEIVMLDETCLCQCRRIIGSITGTPQENIWIHVTHAITTPHTPGPMGPPDKKTEPTEADKHKAELYYQAIKEATRIASEEAAKTFSDARIGVGTGECYVNRNRDVETAHGWWIGLGEGPSNRDMTVIRFEDSHGGPLAFLISYALKPCAIDNSQMSEGRRLVSSDVPGEACRIMEERFHAPTLFCMSAAGDQVPREMAYIDSVTENGKVLSIDSGVKKGLEIVERLGAEMGRDAVSISEKINCNIISGDISVASDAFQWDKKKRGKMQPEMQSEFRPDGTVSVDVGVIRLGNVAFVSVKPEINYLTEKQLHEASPCDVTLLISMVNGGMKYMPEKRAYFINSWEAQSSALMPGAAEKFLETAADLLNKQCRV